MRKLFMVVGLLVAALGVVVAGCGGDSEPGETELEAIAAAEQWLAIVDRGDYAASHEQAAAYFKGAVTAPAWRQQIAGVRAPLGQLQSRAVQSSQVATSLPGAPDGEYVVIQFQTSYENKADAVETVTPMRDADGVFRVSGYFIR